MSEKRFKVFQPNVSLRVGKVQSMVHQLEAEPKKQLNLDAVREEKVPSCIKI